MRLMGVVTADKIEMGDHLVGTPASTVDEGPIARIEVMSVFNSGHERVQITTRQAGIGWLNAGDLIVVLREVT